MFVKPAAGALVRDPQLHDFLPPEGREVEPSAFWRQRLLHGDVVRATAPAAAADLVPQEQPAATPETPAAAD